MNIPADGIALHRAIDDSVLSAECLRRTFDADQLTERMVKMDRELYGRLSFKVHFITDRNDPRLDEKQLQFVCPFCSGALHAKEDWSLHNKQFFQRILRVNDIVIISDNDMLRKLLHRIIVFFMIIISV